MCAVGPTPLRGTLGEALVVLTPKERVRVTRDRQQIRLNETYRPSWSAFGPGAAMDHHRRITIYDSPYNNRVRDDRKMSIRRVDFFRAKGKF